MKKLAHRLLKSSEKYFKTDMIYLVKGSFWLVGGQVITALGAFAFSIVISHTVPKEIFGTYSFILSVVELVMAFSLSGLGTSLTRAVAMGNEGEFKRSMTANFQWGILTSLAFLVLAVYYFSVGNSTLGFSLVLAGLLVNLIDSGDLYISFLNGKKQFSVSSLLQAFRSLLSFSAVGATAYFTKNPLFMVSAYFLTNALFVTGALIYIWNHYKLNDKHDRGESLHLAKNLSVMNFLASTADNIDKVLVFHFLGAAPLAIYNYALAIPNAFNGFVKNIGTLATPKISMQQDKTSVQLKISEKTLRSSFLILIPAIGYAFTAYYIYRWFFPQYLDSLYYSIVYMFGLVLNGSIPVAFLDAHKAIKEKYILNISSNIIKIGLVVGGVYFLGLWGLILARVAAKLIGLVTSLILAKVVDRKIVAGVV